MQYILTSWVLLILLMVSMGISAQDLDKFSLKNPGNVSVKLSSTATFYSSNGDSQRDSFYWLINGSVNVSGIAIPISFTFNQQELIDELEKVRAIESKVTKGIPWVCQND
ncbi:MAG: hypothetical protein AAGA64_16780 [Bacteroidota bacterium]